MKREPKWLDGNPGKVLCGNQHIVEFANGPTVTFMCGMTEESRLVRLGTAEIACATCWNNAIIANQQKELAA